MVAQLAPIYVNPVVTFLVKAFLGRPGSCLLSYSFCLHLYNGPVMLNMDLGDFHSFLK